MSTWTSKTKTMRLVGKVWLDPIEVTAAEEIKPMVARFHLTNGNVIDAQIPGGKTLDWMMGRLFPKATA